MDLGGWVIFRLVTLGSWARALRSYLLSGNLGDLEVTGHAPL